MKGRKEKEASTPEQTPMEAITGHKHTLIIDWDGTLVPAKWPERPREWMPGAVEFLQDATQYAHVIVFSARTRREDPFTQERIDPELVQEEIDYIRGMLDAYQLQAVKIWTRHGKPSGDIYIDDKGERYNQRPGSWRTLQQKCRLRFGQANGWAPPWEKGLS